MSQILSPQVEGAVGVRRGAWQRSTARGMGGGITVLAVDDWGSQQDGRRKQEKRQKRETEGDRHRKTHSDIRSGTKTDMEKETTE